MADHMRSKMEEQREARHTEASEKLYSKIDGEPDG